MNDTDMVARWALLEPGARRRARITTRVFDWLEARDSSLAAEWLGLLKGEPVRAVIFASLGAFSLVLLTPVGWLAAVLIA